MLALDTCYINNVLLSNYQIIFNRKYISQWKFGLTFDVNTYKICYTKWYII